MELKYKKGIPQKIIDRAIELVQQYLNGELKFTRVKYRNGRLNRLGVVSFEVTKNYRVIFKSRWMLVSHSEYNNLIR